MAGGVAAVLYRLPDLLGAGEFVIAVGALAIGRTLIAHQVVVPALSVFPRWDVPLRMTTAAAAVVLFTGVAALLGPRLSGFVSAFPVVTMILVVFTHAQRGHESVATFLRGLLRGLQTFAVLCLAFAITLGTLGWPLFPAFSAALAAQCGLQAALLHRERPREAPAEV